MTASIVPPDRLTFRTLVADVAAKAKAKLPDAVNGRIESAVKLVLAHDVTFLADGTVEVGSSSDPLKTYTLAGHACDCQDCAYGKAPDGWCAHRIAAGIAKRVQEQLDAQASQTPQEPTSASQTTVDTSGPSETSTALPEAPASATVRLTIAGHPDVLFTLRDTDEDRLLVRLQALLAQFPVEQKPQPQASSQNQLTPQQHNAAAMHRKVTGFCQIHNVQMPWNEPKQPGRKGWWSHRTTDGQWCKGRG